MIRFRPKNRSKHKAEMRRIRELPRAVGNLDEDPTISAILKRDAEGCAESIRTVIEKGDAKPRLGTMTRTLKKMRGSSRVNTPLMSGDKGNTMLDGIVVIKSGRGWICTVSGMHHSGLPQSAIWSLHERGFSVRRSPKFVNFLHSIGIHIRYGGVFTIPGRRPFSRGLNRYIRGRARRGNSVLMTIAVRKRVFGKK